MSREPTGATMLSDATATAGSTWLRCGVQKTRIEYRLDAMRVGHVNEIPQSWMEGVLCLHRRLGLGAREAGDLRGLTGSRFQIPEACLQSMASNRAEGRWGMQSIKTCRVGAAGERLVQGASGRVGDGRGSLAPWGGLAPRHPSMRFGDFGQSRAVSP